MSGKKIAAIGIIGAAALGAILIATKPPVKEVTPPPVQQCSSTSHCPKGQICVNGNCVSATMTISGPATVNMSDYSATYTANVKANGSPIASYPVAFSILKGASVVYSKTVQTDSSGNASITYVFPEPSVTTGYTVEALI